MGEPQFSDPAVYTPAFKDTIQSGHFVKVELNDVVFYGRIIVMSHSVSDIAINERPVVDVMQSMAGYLKVNWYLKREELPFHNNRNNDTVHHTGNIYTSSVDELFQTPNFNWIVSSYVTELLFVFHYSDVICGTYCCSGMENAFFFLTVTALTNLGAFLSISLLTIIFLVALFCFGTTGHPAGRKMSGKPSV